MCMVRVDFYALGFCMRKGHTYSPLTLRDRALSRFVYRKRVFRVSRNVSDRVDDFDE